jgi:hypothetical protein
LFKDSGIVLATFAISIYGTVTAFENVAVGTITRAVRKNARRSHIRVVPHAAKVLN